MDNVIVYDTVFAEDKLFPSWDSPIPKWYLDYMDSMGYQELCGSIWCDPVRSKEEALAALQPFLQGEIP